MATYEVTAPDGKVYEVTAPDGATQEEVLSYAKNKFSSGSRPMEHKEYAQVHPVQRTGNVLDFLRGGWSGLKDVNNAGEQRVAEAASLFDESAVPERDKLYEEEKQRRYNREFNPDVTQAERIGHGVASMGVPMAFAAAPKAASAAASLFKSLIAGGASGLTMPSTSPNETLMNVGTNAASFGAGDVFARAYLPTSARNLTQARKDVIDAAAREKIPLRTSEATGSRVLKNYEQMRSNRPITGGMEERFNNEQTAAINRAISRKLGKELPEVNDKALEDFYRTIGKDVGKYTKGKDVPLDIDYFNAIVDVETAARVGGKLTYLPEIKKTVDNALDFITTGKTIPGEDAQAIRSILLRRARDARAAENNEIANAIEDIAAGLKKAMDGTMSAAEKKGWDQANRMYANYKLVEEAFIRDPRSLAEGDVPINKLARVMEQNRPRSYVHGRGDFADLAKLGQVIRPPGRSALLGAQGTPVIKELGDIFHGFLYPVTQSKPVQKYLSGGSNIFPPGAKFIRDAPNGQATFDALMRAAGLTLFTDEDK